MKHILWVGQLAKRAAPSNKNLLEGFSGLDFYSRVGLLVEHLQIQI